VVCQSHHIMNYSSLFWTHLCKKAQLNKNKLSVSDNRSWPEALVARHSTFQRLISPCLACPALKLKWPFHVFAYLNYHVITKCKKNDVRTRKNRIIGKSCWKANTHTMKLFIILSSSTVCSALCFCSKRKRSKVGR
jgi:hypothetical protein